MKRWMHTIPRICPIFQEYMKKLEEHPLVGEVTGLGLMGGLEIVRDKKSRTFFDSKLKVTRLIEEQSFKRGLIVRGMGERIALAPPLITSEKELIEIFQRFTAALDETYSEISTPTL